MSSGSRDKTLEPWLELGSCALFAATGAAVVAAFRCLRLRFGWLDSLGDVSFWLLALPLIVPLTLLLWAAVSALGSEALRLWRRGPRRRIPRGRAAASLPPAPASPPGARRRPRLDCPFCRLALPNGYFGTCGGCGFWWIASGELDRAVEGRAAPGLPSLKLELREDGYPAVSIGLLLCFAGSGLGISLISIIAWIQGPSRLSTWIQEGFGTVVGGVIGGYSSVLLLQLALRSAFPARLLGDAAALSVDVWSPAGELLRGFRRLRARVPLRDVRGVVLITGQHPETDAELGLRHASGLTLSLGLIGSAERAQALGQRLADWLASRQRDG